MNKPTPNDYLPHNAAEGAQDGVQDNPWRELLMHMAKPEPHGDDYIGEDGLIYCGHCHTPRQFVMQKDNCLKGCVLPIACKCRQARLDAREAELQAQRTRELRRRAFSSPLMLEWNFAHDDGSCKQMEVAHRYVRKWGEIREKNYGLYLWGDVGTGKSFFAGCIANALIDLGIAARMASFPQVMAELQADFNRQAAYIADLVSYPLLVLDDFGVERGTAFVQEMLFSLIDARLRERKPLIITSNINPDVLKNPKSAMEARIYDRILQMCVPMHIEGPRRRASSTTARDRDFRSLMRE